MSEQSANPAAHTDAILVRLAKAGKSKAFDLLILRYQPRIMSRIQRSVKNQNDVPDLTQEVFFKAWKGLANFREEAEFYTWLYRIMLNTIANYLDGKSRRPPDHDLVYGVEESYAVEYQTCIRTTPESELLAQETKAVIHNALSRMHPSLRNALLLRELQGLTYEEIALTLNCPIGTVRSRIFRAREFLDQAVRGDKVQPEP